MEKLRINIEKYLAETENKMFISNIQRSSEIISIIKEHKPENINSCPRCLSTEKETYILGFHHICKDFSFKY